MHYQVRCRACGEWFVVEAVKSGHCPCCNFSTLEPVTWWEIVIMSDVVDCHLAENDGFVVAYA